MTEYHFMADVLTPFRSCPDFIKAPIVGGFYATVMICVLGARYPSLLENREGRGAAGREDTAGSISGEMVVDLAGKRLFRREARG